MNPSALARLAQCSDGTEIWLDSSPLVYARWRDDFLARHGKDIPGLKEHLNAFFQPGEIPYGFIRGSTTNQPITLQAFEADLDAWGPWIVDAARAQPQWSPEQLAYETYKEVVRRGSEYLLGVFESCHCRYGFICGQVDPRLNDDTEAMVAQALDLKAANPNVMIKMPGTAAGIEGVRRLAARGIATTTTLAFSVPQLVAVAEAADAGRAEAEQNGVDLSHWRSCGVMMLGRFEDHPVFREQAAALGIELAESDLRWAGIAILKEAYRIYGDRGYGSKLLAASMRLGPVVGGKQRIWHLEKLAGMDVVLTIFPNIIEAFLLSYQDEALDCAAGAEPVPQEVLDKLLRIPYFRQAYYEDGLQPEEFAIYPPVVATAESFTKAMVDFEKRVAALAAG